MFAFLVTALSRIALLFFMRNFLIFIGAIALIGGTYSKLISVRKAELSYALSPSRLQGEVINRCYPTTFHSPQEVRYVQSDGYRYYEVIAKPKFSTSTNSSDEFVANTYATVYIRTIKDACKWLNRHDLRSGRLKFMPKSAAIALAKLRYSEVINNCLDSLPKETNSIACTKQLEVAVNQPPNWASFQIDYLFPEDAAALSELGVKTDKVLIVKSIENLESQQKMQEDNVVKADLGAK